jgi:potassium-dependent mechanosensitive channel
VLSNLPVIPVDLTSRGSSCDPPSPRGASRTCPRIIAGICASFLAAALLPAAAARAAAEAGYIQLSQARQQLTAIQQGIPSASDRRLRELREQSLDLQTQLQEASGHLEPQLIQAQARMAELGTPSTDTKEPNDVAAQRKKLEQTETTLEGKLRLANLLALEAEQTIGRISARIRAQFRERVSTRFNSPFERGFWSELRTDAPEDFRRARAFEDQVTAILRRSSPLSWLGVLVIATLILLARWQVSRKLRAIANARSWHSLGAFTSVLLDAVSAAIVAWVAVLAFNSDGGPEEPVSDLLSGMVITIAFGIYVYALGTAVRASLRGFSLQFAVMITLASVAEQLATAINASPSSTVTLDGITTLIVAATLASGLRRALRSAYSLPAWLVICLRIGWLAIGGSALCVIVGYVALGTFVVEQLAWGLIVVGTCYVVQRMVVESVSGLMPVRAKDGPSQSTATPLARAAVVVSALASFAIWFIAVLLLLAPYGAGAVDLLPQLNRIRQGVSIGALELRPAPVARSILILGVGLGTVRVLKNWLQRRYLPLTRLDFGMRESVTSLVGYVGYAIATAVALSAMGVGFQQIAWVVSALALGIGFGLQAIVQNFVSGLILLAERPVRVGDWVAIGEFEGDVRRINARATEIQRLDRSTVIVPNSEFITKVVRNITYANPLGRVRIILPMPLGTDVEQVRTELLKAFEAQSDILGEPAPNVTLDEIEHGYILFNATGFVSSPRAVDQVRSAVLFNALVRLKKAGVAMPVPTVAPPVAPTPGIAPVRAAAPSDSPRGRSG